MKAGLAAIACACAVAGCATAGHNHRDIEVERAILRGEAAAETVSETCRIGPIGPRCGLITRHAATEAFREAFYQRACTRDDAEGCQTAMNRDVDARLARRYSSANWEAVARKCDATPDACADPIAHERLLLASHNAVVRYRLADADRRLRNEDARIASARAAGLGSAIIGLAGEVAYTLHPGPKCRTYPSVFTGTAVSRCSY